ANNQSGRLEGRLWEVETGKLRATLPLLLTREPPRGFGEDPFLPRPGPEVPKGAVYPPEAAFSPDGKAVVTLVGSEARSWQLADGKPFGESVLPQGSIYRWAFSPDGRAFVTASGSQVIWWPALDGKLDGKGRRTHNHTGEVTALALARGGQVMLTA